MWLSYWLNGLNLKLNQHLKIPKNWLNGQKKTKWTKKWLLKWTILAISFKFTVKESILIILGPRNILFVIVLMKFTKKYVSTHIVGFALIIFISPTKNVTVASYNFFGIFIILAQIPKNLNIDPISNIFFLNESSCNFLSTH